jgi:hypothetical protein
MVGNAHHFRLGNLLIKLIKKGNFYPIKLLNGRVVKWLTCSASFLLNHNKSEKIKKNDTQM